MDKFLSKIKNFSFKNIDNSTKSRTILFLIPLISIIIKSILFQGFIRNSDCYSLNLWIGIDSSKYCLTYYFAFTLLFLSFALLFKGKGRVIYLFIIDAVLTSIILTDLLYFRGFLTLPSLLIVTQTANLDNMSGSIFSMITPYDLLFLLDFVILGIYVYVKRKAIFSVKKRAIKTFLVSFLGSIVFIGYVPFNIHILNNTDVSNGYMFQTFDSTQTSQFFSPIGYHIFDAYDVYKNSKPYELTDSDKKLVTDYLNFKNKGLKNNEYFGKFKGKNLIVIQVESLENFAVGQEINGKKITPVLDSLKKDGIYFPNIYEQVNQGTSADSDLMVNTSMIPVRTGTTFFRYPIRDYNSMPRILESNGYSTEAFHPDKGSFWNYRNALLGMGFQKFTDFYSYKVDDKDIVGMGISDGEFFNQITPMIKELKEPFYAFTVTLTSHMPFELPKDMRKLNLNPELDKSEMGGYLESIHYTDSMIGNFLKSLDKEGLLDNTVVAITGDHTGVHKYYGHTIDMLSKKEPWFSDDGNPRVPLIIYDKNQKIGKKFDVTGGQIDIMPTLLYGLGIPSDEYKNSTMGRSLLNTDKDYAILNSGRIVGDTKDLSEKDINLIKDSQQISDMLIRANYFGLPNQ